MTETEARHAAELAALTNAVAWLIATSPEVDSLPRLHEALIRGASFTATDEAGAPMPEAEGESEAAYNAVLDTLFTRAAQVRKVERP